MIDPVGRQKALQKATLDGLRERARQAEAERDVLKARFDRDVARLADEVAVLVRRKVIDARSPAGDALLDLRDPPSTPRADRIAVLERKAADWQRAAQAQEAANRDERAHWSRLYGLLTGQGADFQGCYSAEDLERVVEAATMLLASVNSGYERLADEKIRAEKAEVERDDLAHTLASRTPTAIRVCAVGVVRRPDGSLLLGRRRQRDSAHGQWVMPGGGVHLGERMEDAARREVLEETGVEVRVGRLLVLFQHFDDGCHRVVGFYEADPVDGAAEPRAGSDLDEPRFVPEAEMDGLDLSLRTREVRAMLAREANLEARVKMLEGVLAFYASPESWEWRTTPTGEEVTSANLDGGRKARAVLDPPAGNPEPSREAPS